jgi:hypothetical protein
MSKFNEILLPGSEVKIKDSGTCRIVTSQAYFYPLSEEEKL